MSFLFIPFVFNIVSSHTVKVFAQLVLCKTTHQDSTWSHEAIIVHKRW